MVLHGAPIAHMDPNPLSGWRPSLLGWRPLLLGYNWYSDYLLLHIRARSPILNFHFILHFGANLLGRPKVRLGKLVCHILVQRMFHKKLSFSSHRHPGATRHDTPSQGENYSLGKPVAATNEEPIALNLFYPLRLFHSFERLWSSESGTASIRMMPQYSPCFNIAASGIKGPIDLFYPVPPTSLHDTP